MRSVLTALVVWTVAAWCAGSFAQTFPSKPIRLVVGHAPGGQADTIGRIVGPRLAEYWGQPVVIENRVGAAGTISASLVAKAAADGHTLLVASSSNLAIAAAVVKELPFEPTRDFAMIGRIASIPTVFAVGSWIPARNVSELVAYAKSRPGQLTSGSSGHGSSSGFALEMLKAAAAVDILQVPYGGLAPAVTGLVSHQVDMVFADFALVNPHVQSGALRLIAAAGSRRLAVAPDLPTIREQGFDGVAVDSFIGIIGPAGMPPETIAKLTSGLEQVMRMPDIRKRMLDLGFDPIDDTPALFAAALRDDIEKFSRIARRMGLGNAK